MVFLVDCQFEFLPLLAYDPLSIYIEHGATAFIWAEWHCVFVCSCALCHLGHVFVEHCESVKFRSLGMIAFECFDPLQV